MKNNGKRIIQFTISIIISIIFLYLAVRKVKFAELLENILSANLWYLLISLVLALFGLIIRSKRWQYIANKPDSKYRHFFESTSFGLMINNVLPFRIGDFAQAYLLSKKENLTKSRSFSTIIMERLSDLVPPVLILITGSFFVFLPKEITKGRIFIFVIIVFLGLFLLVKLENNFVKLINFFLPEGKIKERILGLFQNFLSAMSVIKSPYLFTRIFGLTFFVWFIYALSTYFCLLAFDIPVRASPSLNLFHAALIVSITAIAYMIPASPGALGTFEFFNILALAIFHIDKTSALSYALVNHFIGWVPVTLLGIYVLLKSGLSIKQIENEDIGQENSNS